MGTRFGKLPRLPKSCRPLRSAMEMAMKKLLESCDNGNLFLDLPARDLDDAVSQIVDELVHKGAIDSPAAGEIKTELKRKEKLTSTTIGHSLSVPHAYLDCIANPLIAIARLQHGINEGAPDGTPVRFVILLLGPGGATSEHLDSLADIAHLMSDDEFHYLALTASNGEEFRSAIESRMKKKTTGAPAESAGEGLRYTGRLFGGVMEDIQRRSRVYWSDLADGFHLKTLSSTFFLFFACLAPAIIFGGLMYAETGGQEGGVGQIGAVEMILATCICGLVYALLAGQPMIILGGTGPMLVFTAILYNYCKVSDLPFLPVYAWVGIWTGIILLILAATDASCMMRYFTRFTDEIFAALISIIFIYKSVEKLIHIFQHAHEAETLGEATNQVGYDVALLSLLLALGTFYVATSLSAFRRSHLLFPAMREFLADFGPTIAIISMALIAFFTQPTILVESLKAPESFKPSVEDRAWFVNFMQVPTWVIFASIIPALLCSVLVFLDQNITARLVNSPDNNLQKGESYHHDLGIVGLLVAGCSLFGLPWLVAATVRSLNHVRSLATTEEVVDGNGSTHTHILHVRETRMTGILIHLLVGLSLLLLPYMKYIPMCVLFGLFLYMGVVSMKGNQFFERLSLWATDPALYPKSHYVRRVPWKTMHLFTFIQLVCLVVLWVVKESSWGILFPLFIAVLVPIRFALSRFFEPKHIEALDAEENPEDEEETWS